MDSVYLVRNGNQNEELRYSLRSLERYVTADDVWIVGYCPPWLTNVNDVPVKQNHLSHRNTCLNMLAACDEPRISDPFLLWNDDFFALREPDHFDWCNGYLDDTLARYSPFASYRTSCIRTLKRLADEGFDDPLSFDLHIPLVVYKDLMRPVVADIRLAQAIWKRTVYGNHALRAGLLDPVPRTDVKIKNADQLPSTGDDWISTNDQAFRKLPIGEYLRKMFPVPSRYEVVPEGTKDSRSHLGV